MTSVNAELFHREQEPEFYSSEPRECPGCGRIMSKREAREQSVCNDCSSSECSAHPSASQE